jgi:beta-lactamase class A
VEVGKAQASRRVALTLGAGALLSTAAPLGGSAHAAPAQVDGGRLLRRFAELEHRYAARLGVFAHDTATGRSVRYRAGERFPMCSVFKTLAAAAVLRDLDRSGEFLAQRIPYDEQTVTDSGYGPITGDPDNLAHGMTVEELCDASIRYSDNAAANLLLRELGGPRAVTRFCRSVGDRVTRLDRWEPELNSAEPWRRTDTTTPRAIAGTYARLTLGDALDRGDRRRLTRWLLGNTTSGAKFRAGLPEDWAVADKTGGGEYGTNNDVGLTWPPGRPPIVLAVLTTRFTPDAERIDPLVAEAARLVAAELG